MQVMAAQYAKLQAALRAANQHPFCFAHGADRLVLPSCMQVMAAQYAKLQAALRAADQRAAHLEHQLAEARSQLVR